MNTCKHGLASGCADCKTRARQQPPDPRQYDFGALYEMADEDAAPVIEARFHGTCPLCGLRWEPGDEIARSDDEDAWAHASCAAAERE